MSHALLFMAAALLSVNGTLAQEVTGVPATRPTYQLRVTPDDVVESVTQNVTLKCGGYGHLPSQIIAVVALRILKRQDGNIWTTFAELRQNDQNVRAGPAVSATGNLSDPSFIQVAWPVATNETFGQYRCDAAGSDESYSDAVELSPVVTVVRHNITARQVLNLLLKEEEYTKQELALQMEEQNKKLSAIIDVLNQTQILSEYLSEQVTKFTETHPGSQNLTENVIHGLREAVNQTQIMYFSLSQQLASFTETQSLVRNKTDTAMQNLQRELATQSVTFEHDIDVIFSDLRHIANISHTTPKSTTQRTTTASTTLSPRRIALCRNESLENPAQTSLWPEGAFGLLMPETGCPSATDCTDWDTGFYKFYTERDNNHNKVSNSSHLATPVQEKEGNKTYMYQRFCYVTSQYPNPAWPNGTYCINRGINPCPSGFDEGWIHYDEEDTDHTMWPIVGGVPPYRSYVGNIFYCCRADGPHDTPIILPTSQPFYLYRYQNSCQLVAGMTAQEEYMLFDTENDNNRDNSDRDNYHPDSSMNDVNITLCYYHKDDA